jgi:dihydrofolate reductase
LQPAPSSSHTAESNASTAGERRPLASAAASAIVLGMRKVILSMMVSLDGRIAAADGNLDWFRSGADFERHMLALLRSVDAFIFGRVAYELLSEYWPGAESASDAPPGDDFSTPERRIEFARLMNAIPKIVVSTTLRQPKWAPARVIGEDITGEIGRLKQQAGKDLALFAGAKTATTFMNLDLVDDIQLLVHPLVLGGGPSLFQHVDRELKLELSETRRFDCGVVASRYRRVRQGS